MNYQEYKNERYKDYLPKIIQVIDFDNLKEPNRSRHIAHKRFYLMWVMRVKMKMNLQEIADLFNMHHATVIHGVKYHNNSIEIKDLDYKNNVELVSNFLGIEI